MDPLDPNAQQTPSAPETELSPANDGDANRPSSNSVELGVAGSSPDPTSPAPARAPADPNAAAGVAPAQQQSFRDMVAARGYQLDPAITDDAAAFNHLIQQAQAARQSDVYAQLGRQLAPQAEALLGQMRQQRAAQQAPAAPPSWQAPEFDPRWAQLVDRHESGVFISKPGAPPEIADKVNAYVQWREKFDANPAAMIEPMVEARAQAIAERVIEARFASRDTQSAVNDIMRSNSAWLYQADANGSMVYGQDGRPQLSPYGVEYGRYVQTLAQYGVTDVRAQDRLARQHVMTLAAAAQGQQQAAPGQAAQVQSALAGARPNVNPLQAAGNPAAPPADTTGLSLREKLLRSFAAASITDQDIENSLTGAAR